MIKKRALEEAKSKNIPMLIHYRFYLKLSFSAKKDKIFNKKKGLRFILSPY